MPICDICPHACRLKEGATGVCGVRTVKGDSIVSSNYGQATALALDPIEKKPLARFHPGTKILSYGSYGCNLTCSFCQNSDISMADMFSSPPTNYVSPERLAEEALALKPQGNIGIAFTYNEPLIALEYLIDAARSNHKNGLYNVAVTNGYATERTVEKALNYLDALNIDLKCFTEEGYRSIGAPGGLEAVRRTIAMGVSAGAHVEVTTLVVPGLSDDTLLFEQECEWLASLSDQIPLHISRFFPAYKTLDSRPTPLSTLDNLYQIARRSLEYVYLGNV